MKTPPDIHLVHHGSIVLLFPATKVGKAWAGAHLPGDVMTFGRGIVVEPRYIDDIVEGAMADGLECAWSSH